MLWTIVFIGGSYSVLVSHVGYVFVKYVLNNVAVV